MANWGSEFKAFTSASADLNIAPSGPLVISIAPGISQDPQGKVMECEYCGRLTRVYNHDKLECPTCGAPFSRKEVLRHE